MAPAVPAPPWSPLPIPRTRLIGQETERATARAFLIAEAVPLLTLIGPGGVGKTRLRWLSLMMWLGTSLMAGYSGGWCLGRDQHRRLPGDHHRRAMLTRRPRDSRLRSYHGHQTLFLT